VDSSVVRRTSIPPVPGKRGCAGEVEALVVDRRGLPMRFLLTPGRAGDNPQLIPLLDGISVARTGAGRPRCRPETVIADKAYSHPSTRQAMRTRRITLVSPERDDQITRRAAKGSLGGRPPAFDAEIYMQRNVVGRCFNRLKTVLRPGHPLRQTRRLLPSRTHHRRHYPLAPMT
jgi:transposase